MKGHIELKNLHREEARKANPQTPLSSVTLVHLIQLEARAWLGLEAEWLRAGTWGHTGGLGCILEMRKPRDREVRSISTVQQSGCLEAGVRGRRCNSRVLVSLGYRISHRRSPSLCICYNNGKETECGRKHFSPGQLRRCPVKARNRARTKEQ